MHRYFDVLEPDVPSLLPAPVLPLEAAPEASLPLESLLEPLVPPLLLSECRCLDIDESVVDELSLVPPVPAPMLDESEPMLEPPAPEVPESPAAPLLAPVPPELAPVLPLLAPALPPAAPPPAAPPPAPPPPCAYARLPMAKSAEATAA